MKVAKAGSKSAESRDIIGNSTRIGFYLLYLIHIFVQDQGQREALVRRCRDQRLGRESVGAPRGLNKLATNM